MAIKGNVGIPALAVTTGDTVLVNPTSLGVERVAITAMLFANTTAGAITVLVYESPDLTSASGELIDTVIVPISGNISADIIGQGYTTSQNIIGVASGAGVNASTAVTTYDDGD